MTNEITITFPAIPAQVIAELNETETILAQEEVAFPSSPFHNKANCLSGRFRERFFGLAQHNGNIMIADYDMATSNYRVDRSLYYERDGKRVRGLLALDAFETDHSGPESRHEKRDAVVSLLPTGEWATGSSGTVIGRLPWQGEAQWWGCGVSASADSDGDYNDIDSDGSIRIVTDEEVAEEYKVSEIASDLVKALGELAKKLPERLTRKRALAESLKAVTEQLAKLDEYNRQSAHSTNKKNKIILPPLFPLSSLPLPLPPSFSPLPLPPSLLPFLSFPSSSPSLPPSPPGPLSLFPLFPPCRPFPRAPPLNYSRCSLMMG